MHSTTPSEVPAPSARRTLFHVSAFTRTPDAGNPAGVLLGADGLAADEMHAIAAELGHSETAFVLAPDADDHDVIVRFFTPDERRFPSAGTRPSRRTTYGGKRWASATRPVARSAARDY